MADCACFPLLFFLCVSEVCEAEADATLWHTIWTRDLSDVVLPIPFSCAWPPAACNSHDHLTCFVRCSLFRPNNRRLFRPTCLFRFFPLFRYGWNRRWAKAKLSPAILSSTLIEYSIRPLCCRRRRRADGLAELRRSYWKSFQVGPTA